MHRIIYILQICVCLFICCTHAKSQERVEINKSHLLNHPLLSQVIKSNGKIHLNDLKPELYLVFDTISRANYNEWGKVGKNELLGVIKSPNYSTRIKLKTLNPQKIWDRIHTDSISKFKISENEYIIPFNSDEETTIYTNWQKDMDSIQFITCYTPNLDTKYTTTRVVDLVQSNSNRIIISRSFGGEGGYTWESVWIAKLNSNYTFSIIDEVTIGMCHDCGDWAKLEYSVNEDFINIFEKRDVMEAVNDLWEIVSSRTTALKRINY